MTDQMLNKKQIVIEVWTPEDDPEAIDYSLSASAVGLEDAATLRGIAAVLVMVLSDINPDYVNEKYRNKSE